MPRSPFTLRSRRHAGDTVVGLEIEPSHIAAAEVSVNGKLVVERAAVQLLEPRLVRDGEPTDVEALAARISEMFETNGFGRRVRVGLAHQRIVVRTLDIPMVDDPRELDAAIAAQARDHIPMPMDEAVLDHVVLGPVATLEGPRLRVVVVAVRRDTVERMVAVTRAAGLEVVGLDLSAFAMLRSLDLDQAGDESAVLVVNVGGLINLAVASGRSCLFTRSTPGGLEELAATLAERCSLTIEHARQWIRHVGLLTPIDDVDGDPKIVQPAREVLSEGVSRVADGIRNSLNFYRMQDHAERVDRAVLTGPVLDVPGFREELERVLRMPVSAAGVTAPAGTEDVDATRLSVAAGLAIAERA
jgi:type IV pilus assembly protein PilM